jgi:DNA-binding NarL/FixJ family response regulator
MLGGTDAWERGAGDLEGSVAGKAGAINRLIMPIKVIIVEDDSGLRETLVALLKREKLLECLHACAHAEEAMKVIPASRPDVVIMDINLPRMDGIQCVQKLKVECPQTQFLMLTMYEDGDLIFQSLMAGASGYLLKRSTPEELVSAIQEVHAGGAPMSRQIARKVIDHFHGGQKKSAELESLTEREQQILALLAKGFLYKEIADQLGISVETVRGHLHRVYEKLHVHSRTEAVLKFLGKS